jgi:hypothetical protein
MIPASKSIDGFSRKNGARLAGSSQRNFHFTVYPFGVMHIVSTEVLR